VPPPPVPPVPLPGFPLPTSIFIAGRLAMLNSEIPKLHASFSVLEVDECCLSNVFEHDASNSRHGINRFFKVDQILFRRNSFGGFKDLDIVKYNAKGLNKFFIDKKIYLKS